MLRTCILLMIIVFSSCRDENNKPDVSGIRTDVRVEEFEDDFFAIDTNRVQASLEKVFLGHREFYPFFMTEMLGTDMMDQNNNGAAVRNFIHHHLFLFDSIEKKYPDFNWLEKDLEENLRYVKYYFPGFNIPRFVTFIGPLYTPGVVVLNNMIGIGLHQFAGKNSSIYHSPEIIEMYPLYISRLFDRDYMLPAAMKGVVNSLYPDSTRGRPLIEQMIEKGKEWYLLDKFLPDVHDSLITGFTGRQLEWCEDNEGHIWNQVVRTEDIYTIDPEILQNYIGPAPFTQGMPQEYSPGNIGQWIGWRIVQKFADRKEGITPKELIAIPASTIYNEAKYKPK